MLAHYEKLYAEGEENALENILLIANFYSACYCLNYVKFSDEDIDHRLMAVLILRDGDEFFFLRANIFFSAENCERLRHKTQKHKKIDAGIVFYHNELPQIYINGKFT